ncbi:conserved protein of unknown function [Oenococcus oeni]|uniref:Uncharacterized protein n=1 Tax=Oenococcus oeni TaxID=1247 RepID=A0AAQ2ZF17_OENOE|nr:conserved hypothetical protein [Oenococcus oeni]VDB98780.1 conserved protein of unknown function [Oenococcus oeni]
MSLIEFFFKLAIYITIFFAICTIVLFVYQWIIYYRVQYHFGDSNKNE